MKKDIVQEYLNKNPMYRIWFTSQKLELVANEHGEIEVVFPEGNMLIDLYWEVWAKNNSI